MAPSATNHSPGGSASARAAAHERSTESGRPAADEHGIEPGLRERSPTTQRSAARVRPSPVAARPRVAGRPGRGASMTVMQR
jgi:hypothetical protein